MALAWPVESITPAAVTICGRWSPIWTRATSGSPIALIGFSLGANLVLKLAAEAADVPLPGLDCVLAANPPIDLAGLCAADALTAESAL